MPIEEGRDRAIEASATDIEEGSLREDLRVFPERALDAGVDADEAVEGREGKLDELSNVRERDIGKVRLKLSGLHFTQGPSDIEESFAMLDAKEIDGGLQWSDADAARVEAKLSSRKGSVMKSEFAPEVEASFGDPAAPVEHLAAGVIR